MAACGLAARLLGECRCGHMNDRIGIAENDDLIVE
jgi:hypothetical protein